MPSAMYPKGKGSMAKKQIDMVNDDIRVAIMKASYSYNAAHQYVSDLGANISARSGNMANKSVTDDGIFDADDTTIQAVPSSDVCASVIVYAYNASDNAARLISYHEGVNLTANGQDVIVSWPNGATKIWQL